MPLCWKREPGKQPKTGRPQLSFVSRALVDIFICRRSQLLEGRSFPGCYVLGCPAGRSSCEQAPAYYTGMRPQPTSVRQPGQCDGTRHTQWQELQHKQLTRGKEHRSGTKPSKRVAIGSRWPRERSAGGLRGIRGLPPAGRGQQVSSHAPPLPSKAAAHGHGGGEGANWPVRQRVEPNLQVGCGHMGLTQGTNSRRQERGRDRLQLVWRLSNRAFMLAHKPLRCRAIVLSRAELQERPLSAQPIFGPVF